MGNQMVKRPMTSCDPESSNSRPQYAMRLEPNISKTAGDAI